MASLDIGGSVMSWKESILNQIQNRNKAQYLCYQDLISSHNKIFESWNALKNENIQLNIQYEKLRMEGSSAGGPTNATIISLERKIHDQQEELMELHKKRGENTQILVNLNEKLQMKEAALQERDQRIKELDASEKLLKQELTIYKEKLSKMEAKFQILIDEHQALQLATTHLEDKLRNVQLENSAMVERIMMYKSKDAEKMNEENENFIRKRNAMVQKELADAARDMKFIPPDDVGLDFCPIPSIAVIPNTPAIIFEAHADEVNAVTWSPTEKVVTTGGSDRKVKLWDTSKGGAELRGTLLGSNAGVMSVAYDTSGSTLLGTSADHAVRVWTVSDQRMRHTFTGHSNKVLAARFFGEQTKVVSGSHDRTIKFWDLNSRACTETRFAMSSCNDLVVSDSSGKTVISGHFDKTIKFWDTRRSSGVAGKERPANEIQLQGKVTSLDLSFDGKTLLACVRDDTLRLIDLRMNQVLNTFSADGFVVACDWTRAAFSADSENVAVGSVDGTIYIWNISRGNLETTLKHHTSPVIAVRWHPSLNSLASVDKDKKAIVWAAI